MTSRLIRLPEIEHRTGYKRSHLYDLIKKGKFPRQVELGPKSVAWLESDVEAWIAGRINVALSKNEKSKMMGGGK